LPENTIEGTNCCGIFGQKKIGRVGGRTKGEKER
jgi:hypothetical protein